MIVQTSYRAQDENILAYDIDRYADLFNDLIKSRIYSHNHSLPFYSAQDYDVTPRDLFDSANTSLFAHGCTVTEGIEQQFTIPSIGENVSKVIKIGKDGNENPEVDAPRIVGTFLGGGFILCSSINLVSKYKLVFFFFERQYPIAYWNI